jgi:hypothetical protein
MEDIGSFKHSFISFVKKKKKKFKEQNFIKKENRESLEYSGIFIFFLDMKSSK